MPVRIGTADASITPLIEQIQGWADERAELMARVAEIDEKLARVASLMGVEAPSPSTKGAPKTATYDFRRKGAMIESALEHLEAAPNGLTRVELKNKLREHPIHGERIRRNTNGYYNMVSRALERDELEERGNRLYAPGKAPEEDQPEIDTFDFSGGKPV